MDTVASWTTDFDHLEWRWVENPYPLWADIRAECPMAHTSRYGGVYLPLRKSDICAIANDPEHFSSQSVVVRAFSSPQYSNPPINSDPPQHASDRRVLLPLFKPEAIAALEPRTREICREILCGLRGAERGDVALDYARHIPSQVIAVMLGLPREDGELFLRWIYQTLDAGVRDAHAGETAFAEMTAYFAEQVAHRRSHPGGDLISALIATSVDGKPLSEDHVVGTLRLLLIAGIDTTYSMIGASLLHLATSHADRDRLVGDPALIASAVEEFLRAYSPVTMARVAVKDHEVAGVTIPAGEMVMLPFAAANRDPACFPNPDRVILDREDNAHVAFGFGRHRCVGAGLARMEIRVAIEEWLAEFPAFRRDHSRPVVWSKGTVRGPRTVPVRYG
jgi:cytochrome P450